ncbi:MAG TPA: FkbM family methyltransferase [Candidatus Methylomirabilis sp.]|nr:FkbM family methyltransferase [Candidatus Methylomirabilis sp.]
MRELERFFKGFRNGLRVVPLVDLRKYRRLARGEGRGLVRLRIRNIGNRHVYARAGTEDFLTLYYVFHDRYHLPPGPLPARPVILDLGSNIGLTIVHYKYLHGGSRIIGVEMDEGNFELARRNVSGLGDVELLHNAVSVREGTVSYSGLEKEDAFRILPAAEGHATGHLKRVGSVTIPSIISRYGLSRIDFVKMDIEGEEENVLAPGCDLSWLAVVGSMNIEIHGDASLTGSVLAVLERHGFRAWKDLHHWSSVMAVRS